MQPFLQMSCMEIPYLLLMRPVPDQHDANKNDEPQGELVGGDVADGVHLRLRRFLACLFNLAALVGLASGETG